MSAAVSVIIPFYNREKTLRDAVQSVLAQTYSEFELLLVDDGSTDGSFALANSFNDPRVRVIKHAQNSGAAAARNTGVREAKNAFVAFLDSDDVWHTEKLQNHIPFHVNSGAAASCTSFKMVRENGAFSERHLDEKANWREAFLYGCHVAPGSTLMADRDVFERIGFLDETLQRLEDWDWLLRLVRSERFAALDNVLSDVRVSGYPRYQSVADAIQRLRIRHEPMLADDRKSRGIFLSGLQIECAYISFHNTYHKETILHLFKAFAASPTGFARSVARILKGRLAKAA